MFNDKAKYQHFAIFSCLKRHKKNVSNLLRLRNLRFSCSGWASLFGMPSWGGKPQAQAEPDDFFQFPNYRKTRIKSGRPLPKGRKQHNISA